MRDSINQTQTIILRELLFRESARFAQLQQPTGLTSDHFNFHVRRLVELGLVEKLTDGSYRLTASGKEYANKLDTDHNMIERQPKVSVALIIENDAGELLAQQRLKQPYFGFWGWPTGKIRWGEQLLEAAARELYEETGLSATLEFKGIRHKSDFDTDTKELLEDKFFFVVHGTDPQGELLEQTEGHKNQWLPREELLKKDKVFSDLSDEYPIATGETIGFVEKSYYYKPEEY